MSTLRDMQMAFLEGLKEKGYGYIAGKAPGYRVSDERLTDKQSLSVAIFAGDESSLVIECRAVDEPPSADQLRIIAEVLGADFPATTEAVEWVDGFQIFPDGRIENMHPDYYDD